MISGRYFPCRKASCRLRTGLSGMNMVGVNDAICCWLERPRRVVCADAVVVFPIHVRIAWAVGSTRGWDWELLVELACTKWCGVWSLLLIWVREFAQDKLSLGVSHGAGIFLAKCVNKFMQMMDVRLRKSQIRSISEPLILCHAIKEYIITHLDLHPWRESSTAKACRAQCQCGSQRSQTNTASDRPSILCLKRHCTMPSKCTMSL